MRKRLSTGFYPGRSIQIRLAGLTVTTTTLLLSLAPPGLTQPASTAVPTPNQTVDCELLIVGGGLAGTAATYEALKAGRTVCLIEATDWVGGQITSQGTSALDEAQKQRLLLFYAQGYNELRQRIEQHYGKQNPGHCWVSASCFIPRDAQAILWDQLQDAARSGKGELKWFPSTVIKDLKMSADGKMIEGAIAIQHHPATGTPPLNMESLSKTIEDSYRYEDSPRLAKQIIHFVPYASQSRGANWYVIEATETGEVIALADVPYRLGVDPRSVRNPSASSETGDPYCTQGFTYTFAMEQTEEPQSQEIPSFYSRYEPYYGYDKNPNLASFDAVFTYRRIWAPDATERSQRNRFGVSIGQPGDISMQNWVWGNDYRPGSDQDNLIYTREQLQQREQLTPGGWMGGLRTDTLRSGEEIAQGFYYWLVAGKTDSQLGAGVKQPNPNYRLLKGLDSPMGTGHGLSKYPYIREGRRIIGRPAYGYAGGFTISEIDLSAVDYRSDYYRTILPPQLYRSLWTALSGLEATAVIAGNTPPEQVMRRTRSTIYPDSVGIAQYAIDFHPCMTLSPPELPGNTERTAERQGHGPAYPAEIPLRAMIPQRINNLLVAGKSIATSHIAAAAYRVHSFEWSSGAAAGTTAAFALSEGILPYQLVADLPQPEPLLQKLQNQLEQNGNPTRFPNTSVFNLDWQEWRVW